MTTINSHLLGAQSIGHDSQAQADFYAKLLQLQTDVVTGRHPRYSLSTPAPEHDVTGPSSSAISQVKDSDHTVPNGVSVPRSVPGTSSAISPSGVARQIQQRINAQSSGSASLGKATLVPARSDNLVKAENNLKRMRVERLLKESVDSKKTRSGEKDANPFFGAHTFDCSQLLQAATSLVKPVSGFEAVTANVDRPSSSPPNTESYYSSKVDSRSESPDKEGPAEDGEISDTNLQTSFGASATEQTLQRPPISGLGPPSPPLRTSNEGSIEPAQVTPPREDSYSPPSADSLPYIPQPRPALMPTLGNAQPTIPKTGGRPPTGRSRESESYSPPPVEAGPAQAISAPIFHPTNGIIPPAPYRHVPPAPPPVSARAAVRAARKVPNNKKQGNVNGSFSDKQGDKSKKAEQRRSQATRPLPSNGYPNASNGVATTVNAAPLGLATAQNNRKRRREPDAEEIDRRIPGRMEHHNWQPVSPMPRSPASPMPYIKQEPVSPRIAATRKGVEPPRRLVLRDDGTADIEVDMGMRPAERAPTYADDMRPQRQMPLVSPRYVREEPIYLDDETQPSPMYRRKVQRDDTDLRRVASMQYARRAPSPVQHDVSSKGLHYTPGSHQQVMQQASPRYQYVEDDAEPQRILRPRHSSPIIIPDDYAPRSRMPPPPPAKRRIIIDEYGNEYIATPVGSKARQPLEPEYYDEPQPIARPRLASTSTAREPMYERRSRPRAQPEIIELDDDDDRPMMAPPPRLIPQKRRMAPLYDYEVPVERPQTSSYLRAASSQLAPRRRDEQQEEPQEQQRYRYRPAEPYQPLYDDALARPRAFSARPDLVQQQEIFGERNGWSQMRRV